MSENQSNEKIELIKKFYQESMAELRDRRNYEWQTFLVVNGIYLAGLAALHGIGDLQIGESIAIGIAVIFFTYIWYIRIHANALRYKFAGEFRSNIQNYARKSLPEGIILNDTDWFRMTVLRYKLTC